MIKKINKKKTKKTIKHLLGSGNLLELHNQKLKILTAKSNRDKNTIILINCILLCVIKCYLLCYLLVITRK